MRVRMNVSIAGHSFAYAPRQVVDLPDDLAQAWLACGHASPIADEAAPKEKATGTEPEPKQKRKGR